MVKENLAFIKKSLTFKRFINALKAYMSYGISLIVRKPVVWGMPPVVMIEPTNICNLRCPLCPTGNGTLKREKGYMTLPVFKKIIDQVKDKSFMVVLWNQGEPFLNDDFLEMVKYASDNKMFTLVSTNANVDFSAEAIVKSGLDSMIVSLDGATQETYNKYRVNGQLEKVIKNVESLVSAKRKLNSSKPLLRWQFLVLKHNEHELEDIKKMAISIGVDNLELKSAQVYTKEDVTNFLPKNPKYRRYKVQGDDFELKFGIKNRCRRIWTNLVINWNAELSICCFDKDLDFRIGNLEDNSISTLWKNDAFQRVRKQILKDRAAIEICRNCGEGVKLRIKETKVTH